MPVLFRLINQDRRERGLVGSIRITLRFDSDTSTSIIASLLLPDICSIHKIAIIHLNRGLIGINLHLSSANFIRQTSGKAQSALFRFIQSIS